MAFTKITNADLNSRGATTLPNQPKISAQALKQEFDAPAKVIVAPAVNNLIDELEAETASESIGIVAPEGRGTTNKVQNVVDKISLDLSHLEASFGSVAEKAHTHENKELLDTYAQSETDLADAVTKKHTHSNKSLLDSYNQSNSDISDAVSKKHAHSNKELLDTYNQTNTDLADAVSKKHGHSNKALLDTYTQTEADIADAVTKKHSHSNKSLLDTYNQSNSDIASAVSNTHTHSNKTLLDSYTQTEANLSDAVSQKHSHSNKSLLDTYTQTETDLASAVTQKHSHTNKSVIDKLTDSDGRLLYDSVPVGDVDDAFKSIKAGSTTITASGEDTFELKAGSNVTLTPDATTKSVTISATGGGQATGDMLAADYDDDFDVKTAGGIKDYVTSLNLMKKDGTNAATEIKLPSETAITIGDSRDSGSTIGNGSIAHGTSVVASGEGSIAKGLYATSAGSYTEAIGFNCSASQRYSYARGYQCVASARETFAIGMKTEATAECAYAEGYGLNAKIIASGLGAHAEGCAYINIPGYDLPITASGNGAHAEGGPGSTASGDYSHSQGINTVAVGDSSYAGGYNTRAEQVCGFAFGNGYIGSAYSGVLGFGGTTEQLSSDTVVNNAHSGYNANLDSGITATMELTGYSIYMLLCSGYNSSTGAIEGMSATMISTVCDSNGGTPTALQLAQSATAPATVTMLADNKISVQATNRKVKFSLYRVL